MLIDSFLYFKCSLWGYDNNKKDNDDYHNDDNSNDNNNDDDDRSNKNKSNNNHDNTNDNTRHNVNNDETNNDNNNNDYIKIIAMFLSNLLIFVSLPINFFYAVTTLPTTLQSTTIYHQDTDCPKGRLH